MLLSSYLSRYAQDNKYGDWYDICCQKTNKDDIYYLNEVPVLRLNRVGLEDQGEAGSQVLHSRAGLEYK